MTATPQHETCTRIPLGGRAVHAISDGQFRMPRDFLGDIRAHEALADEHGDVLLPIGCLFVPGPLNVLIDAGFGPTQGKVLLGGALVGHLASLGVAMHDVDIVALTHMHNDHVGWLATPDGDPVFPTAQIVVARNEWRCFLDGEGADGNPSLRLAGHIEQLMRDLDKRGRVTLVDGEERIAPGVTAVLTAGHTPGHAAFVVEGEKRGLSWFGDLIDCPEQLTETGWAASSDVDPERARHARSLLWRQIEETGWLGLGSHFPGLRAGTVESGAWHPLH